MPKKTSFVPDVVASLSWLKSSFHASRPSLAARTGRAATLPGLAGLLLVGMLLTGCEQRERDVSAAIAEDSARSEPSQVSWSVRFALQEAGRRRAHFVADRMAQIETEDSTYVELTMQPLDTAATDTAAVDTLGPTRTMTRDPGQRTEAGGGRDDSVRPPIRTDTLTGLRGRPIPAGRVVAYVFEEGDSSAVITAERMLYFADEGRFEAFGDVEVHTVDNKRLQSEHLTWDQDGRTIRTRRFVRIITPTEDVQGNGLLADEDLDSYQIGRFTADVEMEEEDDETEAVASTNGKDSETGEAPAPDSTGGGAVEDEEGSNGGGT